MRVGCDDVFRRRADGDPGSRSALAYAEAARELTMRRRPMMLP
jgi:hypothetical protein